jgi:NAD(P)-dependent dehydrogenase (short-subunit alcohol dehydrogenase family)
VSSSRVVVVTGAGAGLGRAIAREFAARGDDVALLSRGTDGLDAAAKEVSDAGSRALVLPTDVSSWPEVEEAARRTEAELGPIDVWVNDAMVSVFAPFKDIAPEEFERVTAVTYLGSVYGTMAALRHMGPRHRGTIVQVGSALAIRSIPLQSAYCGAKHGILGFTTSLRSELMHDDSGIQVTMVQMPAMNTPQFSWSRSKMPHHPRPVPPIFQPEVAARAVVFAADHPDRHMYSVGWSTVRAIVGNRIAPGLLDRYLGRKGYEVQQIEDLPVAPDRPDNLWSPVAGDHGAHGIFDNCAKSRSPQFWMTTHKRWLAAGALAATAVAALAVVPSVGRR